MSAIFGMIDFSRKCVEKQVLELMKEPIKKYEIDQYNVCINGNAGMGCALQFFTEESKREHLPYVDEEIFFTADVYLDNREVLYKELEIELEDQTKIPDGMLILKSYQKWGENFAVHLLGSYACAVYDKKAEKVLLVTDYTGNRCLSFACKEQKVIFSTLLEPIKEALNHKVHFNRRWLHDFTAISKLAIASECTETPYEEILQVAPGQIVRITKAGAERINYWNPMKSRKVLKLKNDEEYKKAFIDLYEKIVADSLRSCGETGVLLSGGLDSSSVACIAAKQLKKQGKVLYSFTSVPDAGYKGRKDPYWIADERKSVELIAAYTGNIETNYYDLEGKDAWSDVDELLEKLEIPYKSIQNGVWMENILGLARRKGCRVVLNGQYGNTTVSFGDFFMQLYTLLEKHKYVTLIKEFSVFCKKNHLSRKSMLKRFMKTLVPKWYKAWMTRKKGMFDDGLAKEELLREFHTEERFKKLGLNDIVGKNYSVEKYRPFMYYKEALSQIGIMETKLSLVNGVLIKDPTRDKRMIEFCLNLPPEQYVKDGNQRRLVREYMKGYVPEAVLSNSMYHKGMQSADMIFRLQKHWDEVYSDIAALLRSKEASQYLNIEKVEELLCSIKVPDENQNEKEIVGSIYTAIFVKYMQNNAAK